MENRSDFQENKSDSQKHLEFKTLVLSSGSFNGISQLGVLSKYEEERAGGVVANIEYFAGTSIGSVICYLLILGYSPISIFNDLLILDLNDLVDFDILGIMKNYGVISFDSICDTLERLTLAKMDYLPSLEELYSLYKKSFTAVTYNLSEKKVEYLNYSTHPDMPCIQAIKMSCTIPGFFHKIIYNNHMFIDGAVADSFPIQHAYENFPKPVLGINIEFTDKKESISSFLDYILQILYISYEANTKISREYARKIMIEDKNSRMINIVVDVDDRFFEKKNVNGKTVISKWGNLFAAGYMLTEL